MAGYSDLSTSAKTLGWRYTLDTGFEELGLPPNFGPDYAIPYGINNAGQVVGDLGGFRSFRWTEGAGMIALPTLPGGSSHAYATNDVGQVAGSSSRNGTTLQRVALVRCKYNRGSWVAGWPRCRIRASNQ